MHLWLEALRLEVLVPEGELALKTKLVQSPLLKVVERILAKTKAEDQGNESEGPSSFKYCFL